MDGIVNHDPFADLEFDMSVFETAKVKETPESRKRKREEKDKERIKRILENRDKRFKRTEEKEKKTEEERKIKQEEKNQIQDDKNKENDRIKKRIQEEKEILLEERTKKRQEENKKRSDIPKKKHTRRKPVKYVEDSSTIQRQKPSQKYPRLLAPDGSIIPETRSMLIKRIKEDRANNIPIPKKTPTPKPKVVKKQLTQKERVELYNKEEIDPNYKKCQRCMHRKHVSEYGEYKNISSNNGKTGLKRKCLECDKLAIEALRRRKKILTDHRAEIKTERGCRDCGEKDHRILKFLRRKGIEIGKLSLISLIDEESKKTDVICWNCAAISMHDYYQKKRESTKTPHTTTIQKRRQRDELYAYVNKIKEKHGCQLCGMINVYCLEFDHLDPNQKEAGISEMIAHGKSIAELDKEIAKCRVLCKNCHIMHTNYVQRIHNGPREEIDDE